MTPGNEYSDPFEDDDVTEGAHHAPSSFGEVTSEESASDWHRREHAVWKDRASVQDFLQHQSAQALSEWLLHTADQDSEWRRRLILRVKLDAANQLNDKKKWLNALIGKASKLDKKKARIYAQRMQLVFDMFEPLVRADSWLDISVLAEYALQRLFLTCARADDSDGHLRALCQQILSLHQQAAEHMQAPDLLGPQVARLLVRAPEGIMSLEPYLSLMGEDGQQRFGSSLELLWQAMQLDEVKHSSPVNPTSVRALLMSWYLHQGRIDDWLKLKHQEKWLPETYKDIAQTLRDAERIREAIQVLERGIRQFPEAFALRKLLVDAYLHDGLQEEAQDMLWQQFLNSPTTQHYGQLRAILPLAERARWRDKALLHAQSVEERINNEKPGLPYKGVQLAIWLTEEDDEQCLRLARNFRCDAVSVEALAMRLEHSQQEEAAQLHQQLIHREIERPTTLHFDDAIDRLRHLHQVLAQEVFLALLTRLRLKYAQNRKFLQYLNEQWSPHLELPRYEPPTTPSLD